MNFWHPLPLNCQCLFGQNFQKTIFLIQQLKLLTLHIYDVLSIFGTKRLHSTLHPQHIHWEELLQSVSNFLFRLIINKHCGHTPRGVRGVRGVKRSEILWGIQKYSLPGGPSTHHWVKSKTIIEKHQKLRKKSLTNHWWNFYQQKIFLNLKIDFFSPFFL